MGMILSPILYQSTKERIGFYCPGCEDMHILRIRTDSNVRPSWEYNGNHHYPTFNPSVDVKTGHYVSGELQPPHCEECNEAAIERRPTLCTHCHSYVRNGTIEFLSDCTHKLVGQTVKIPLLPFYLKDERE